METKRSFDPMNIKIDITQQAIMADLLRMPRIAAPSHNMRYICGWSPEKEAAKKQFHKMPDLSDEVKSKLTLARAVECAKRVKRFIKSFNKKHKRHPKSHEVPRHIRDKMAFVHMMKAALDELQAQKEEETANATA